MIPPWEMKNPFRTLEITPNQAFGAPGIPLKPPRREQRNLVLFDPTPSKTAKLCNDILMFQQHHGESLSEAWARFKDLLQKVPHHGIDLWLQVQIFYDQVNPITRRTIDQSAGGKLLDLNPEESWAILEDLALYDNESWNNPRDFAKPVKAIALPQDVPMVPMTLRIAWRTPEQAFVEYASSRTDEAGVPQSSNPKFICSKEDDGEVMFIEIIRDDDVPQNKDPNEGDGATTGEPVVEYFDTFQTRNELTYHREDANGGISNFTGRIKGMHVFVGNFTYILDIMIVKDISSIIDPRMSQVVLGRHFVEISNMNHDPPEGVVRFIRGADKVAYKIEQYNSLSDLEKEHTKSVYLRNKEDKKRRVEYVMSKIQGFYKEYLELGPEYLTEMDDEGEVTLYLMRRSLEVLRKFHWMILGGRFNQLSHVSSPLLSKPGEY
ncbi:hypothetical protein Tco_0658054 [Tanacetum coccineum]